MEDYEIQDSGTRMEFSTGAVRDIPIGKGRFDLLSPISLKRLAVHMEKGCIKYKDRNWEKGIPLHSFFDSAIRHMYTYVYHKMMNTEPDEDHMAAAFWNLHGFLHTEEMIKNGKLPKELDDLYEESDGKK
jgi:hypothetical protein